MRTVAALYIEPGGVYYDVPAVEPWGLPERDARTYEGPHPVVAHPPCARWGRYWGGAPTTWPRLQLGNDGGCFASALHAVRIYGGVLEHPEGSHAWRWFNLEAPPRDGGWVIADALGGWTCCVEQGWYGHRARKATWLYVHGVDLPELQWGESEAAIRPDPAKAQEGRRLSRTGACQRMSKAERRATPPEFRDLLLSIARTAGAPAKAAALSRLSSPSQQAELF